MKRVVYDEVTVVPSRGTMCTAAEGRTRQEAAAATDINRIVERMTQGILPGGLSERPGQFLDLSDVGDLHTSLERVRRAKDAFQSLPAHVRSAFGNDVVKFTEAFGSDEGVAKLRELRVVAETEDTLSERREASAEVRAEQRREARELAKRVEAARVPPQVPPSSSKGA